MAALEGIGMDACAHPLGACRPYGKILISPIIVRCFIINWLLWELTSPSEVFPFTHAPGIRQGFFRLTAYAAACSYMLLSLTSTPCSPSLARAANKLPKPHHALYYPEDWLYRFLPFLVYVFTFLRL